MPDRRNEAGEASGDPPRCQRVAGLVAASTSQRACTFFKLVPENRSRSPENSSRKSITPWYLSHLIRKRILRWDVTASHFLDLVLFKLDRRLVTTLDVVPSPTPRQAEHAQFQVSSTPGAGQLASPPISNLKSLIGLPHTLVFSRSETRIFGEMAASLQSISAESQPLGSPVFPPDRRSGGGVEIICSARATRSTSKHWEKLRAAFPGRMHTHQRGFPSQ
jgi:hypothetical protein